MILAGQIIRAEDLNDLFPGYAAYTPVNTGIVVGNGNLTARYALLGNTCIFTWSLDFGTTTTFAATVEVGIPVVALGRATVSVRLRDQSTPRVYDGSGLIAAASQVVIVGHSEASNGGLISATDPFTWAVNDSLDVSGTYEVTP